MGDRMRKFWRLGYMPLSNDISAYIDSSGHYWVRLVGALFILWSRYPKGRS